MENFLAVLPDKYLHWMAKNMGRFTSGSLAKNILLDRAVIQHPGESSTESTNLRMRIAEELRYCSLSMDLEQGKRLHASILSSASLRHDRFLLNALLRMYGKCGDLESACQVFDRINDPNVFSSAIMISGFADNGHLEGALAFFERMHECDVVCFNTLLQSLVHSSRVEQAKVIFDTMPEHSTASCNTVISAYARFGHLLQAEKVLSAMPQIDAITCTAMASAYSVYGNGDKEKELLESIPEKDTVAWNALLGAYAADGDLETCKSIFLEMPEKDIVSWTALLQAYSQAGDVEGASWTFDSMPEHDGISCSNMLHAYARAGYLDAAVAVYDQKPAPSIEAGNAMVAAYGMHGDTGGAVATFYAMPYTDVTSWNAALHALAACTGVYRAGEFFVRIPVWDVVSWNTMIVGYAHAGKGKNSIDLFQKMGLIGIDPNEITLLGVLLACSHIGQWEKGWKILETMEDDFRVNRGVDHYCAVADAAGRIGQIRIAEGLIREMPFAADGAAWGCLLGSCLIHRDVEHGAAAAKRLLELDPSSAAGHVRLSNVLSEPDYNVNERIQFIHS